jgi:hypothetical protein
LMTVQTTGHRPPSIDWPKVLKLSIITGLRLSRR